MDGPRQRPSAFSRPSYSSKIRSPSLKSAAARFSHKTLLVSVAGLTILVLFSLSILNAQHLEEPQLDIVTEENWDQSHATPPVNPNGPDGLEVWDNRRVINGPPTRKFRDNLKPDVQYVTTWPSAGWTNDVMTMGNLLYLAMLTNRTAILPAFTPSHVAMRQKVRPRSVPFGEVFDVPRLAKALGTPVLEWSDVKNITNTKSSDLETIGCWNLWEATQYEEHFAKKAPGTLIPLNLDVSYMTAPSSVKLVPKDPADRHATFSSLAALSFPDYRKEVLIPPKHSEIKKVQHYPDEQLMCLDYMYYVCAFHVYEYELDYSPVWRNVARHMHWNPKLLEIADEYVRTSLGTVNGEPTPEYIAVHVRHGDFGHWCGKTPLVDCFAPISVIVTRIDEVKEELETRLGLKDVAVIVTSDEKDTEWWAEIRRRGYKTIDHSKTQERFDRWYPVLIDAAIQSSGIGYVGTDRSTMSLMAYLRTKTWRNGAVRLFRWGKPGADDHDKDHQEVLH